MREAIDEPKEQRCLQDANDGQQDELRAVVTEDPKPGVAFFAIDGRLLHNLFRGIVTAKPDAGNAEQE